MNRIVTLTTDFGIRDAYVAAMKGVILGIAPDVRLVDITHDIAPHDVMEAAFALRHAAPYYPPGTIHLAVVDPGVGTNRLALGIGAGGQWYVGPDNGLFALALSGSNLDTIVALDRPAFWRNELPSRTFHGRDIFAPVAAHLSQGVALSTMGSPVAALKPLHWALPIDDPQGIQGWVVHVDRFGNCITNITRESFEERRRERAVKCFAGSAILADIVPTYDASPSGEPLMLFGSSDLLEIAVASGNAAELLSIRKGAPINVVFLDER